MTSAEVLKRGPKRTVLLERAPGERAVVVKRFHDPGRVGRFVDRWRARREERRQRALFDAGLPTPEPLGCHRRGGRWEAWSAFVEGATLDALLDGDAPWPASRTRVAHALGRLLAALDTSGFVHHDAHAGNVLVDSEGTAWILDAGHVSARGDAPTDSDRLALLAALDADVRERASLGFRRRVYESFWSAPSMLQGLDPPLPPLGPEELEVGARALRRDNILLRRTRWLRESGATTQRDRRLEVRVRPAGDLDERDTLTESEAQRRWLAYARFVEHRLPCLAPVSFVRRGARSSVVVALPPGARRLEAAPEPAALGALVGAVHDRGLRLLELVWTDLWRTADGRLLLDAPETADLDPRQRARQWRSELPWNWDALAPDDRRAFLLAYARATRHSRAERKALEAEAEHA